jgi:hypothetical protein
VVLIEDAAEDASPSHGCVVHRHDDTGGVVGWALIEALVRAMPVEVALVRGQHGAGMPVVVDQYVVGALPADAADEPFGITVGPRRRLHRMRMIGTDVSG